jgi:hypothetical protein
LGGLVWGEGEVSYAYAAWLMQVPVAKVRLCLRTYLASARPARVMDRSGGWPTELLGIMLENRGVTAAFRQG